MLVAALDRHRVGRRLYNPLSAYLKQKATELEARIFSRKIKATLRQGSLDPTEEPRRASHHPGRGGGREHDDDLRAWPYSRSITPGPSPSASKPREATLRDGYWELSDARVLGPSEQPQSYGTYLLASNLEPSQVRQTFTPPDSVPFWDLDETIAQTERAGLDATRYRLQYDVLMARPLLFIAMVFVAASVSLRFFRFGGVARMVLGGVTAGFVLYVATQLMEDLGALGPRRPGGGGVVPGRRRQFARYPRFVVPRGRVIMVLGMGHARERAWERVGSAHWRSRRRMLCRRRRRCGRGPGPERCLTPARRPQGKDRLLVEAKEIVYDNDKNTVSAVRRRRALLPGPDAAGRPGDL